ncbi:MAG: adenine deaminase [Sodaliphilus sp.]
MKSGKVVDSELMSITIVDVLIENGVICKVGDFDLPETATVIDCKGKVITAGFIDAHVHIESSMVLPKTFGEVILPFGTTTVIADPHEVVNVAGGEGLKMFLEETEQAPISIFTVVPSCVPATKIETNGAGHFTARHMEPFVDDPRIVGLGEVMTFDDVVNQEPEMMAKLALFKGRPIDGHTAGMDDSMLDAYLAHGISNDHECYDEESVLKRYRKGMNIYIREGSAARNAEELLQCVKAHRLDVKRFAFCTDDKHLSTIQKEGHISHIVRKALEMGFSWLEVSRMASFNTCEYYGLSNRGNIRVGYVADIVVTDDNCESISLVIKDGKQVEKDVLQIDNERATAPNSVKFAELTAWDFEFPKGIIIDDNEERKYHGIQLVDGQLLTEHIEIAESELQSGCKLATIERHGKNGNISVCPLFGYGIENGAVATSVAHDSHNVICAGDNSEDMAAACNRLREIGGGYVIASNGTVVDEFALPYFGLMSDKGAKEAIEGISRLERKAHELKVNRHIDPFTTLSFLALPVIPDIRLLDTGLYDVKHSRFIE